MQIKAIRVAPIKSSIAHTFVREHHYSRKTVINSQLHLGAFDGDRLVGVAQFGPPMDRSKVLHLVAGTRWNGMLELNRLALIDSTPRNTESRFLSICFRLIRSQYPHVQWILSFADATQCGDGAIYRASGFVLTGIKPNNQIIEAPNGERFSRISITGSVPAKQRRADQIAGAPGNGASTMRHYLAAGFRPLPGYQLRYIRFLDPSARSRLSVPEIPFSAIVRAGASMYLGQSRVGSIDSNAPANPAGEDGAIPIPTLHQQAVLNA